MELHTVRAVFLLLLLVATPARGAWMDDQFAAIAAINGAAPAATCDTTDLVSECAEGTGTPSGWTDGGTVDWDEVGTVLQGAQSLDLGAGNNSSLKSFTSSTEVYGFLKFHVADATPATAIALWQERDSGGSMVNKTELRATGAIRNSSAGTADDLNGFTTSNATETCVWTYRKKGATPNTGIMTIWAADCSSVCADGSCSSATAATESYTDTAWDDDQAAVEQLLLLSSADTGGLIIDQILLSTTSLATVTDN